MCLNVLALYFWYRNEELKYQIKIMNIMTHALPVVLQTFILPGVGNFELVPKSLTNC